ncbi:MAG: ankyrin repeat domain-containing protein [Phycisphaerae bacterium]|nr:ankyrin repeat domain-containing protein [Phycisphaerae bacterium]
MLISTQDRFAVLWGSDAMPGLSLAAFCQIFNLVFILYVLVGFISFAVYRKSKRRISHFVAYGFAFLLLGMFQFHFSRMDFYVKNWVDLTSSSPGQFEHVCSDEIYELISADDVPKDKINVRYAYNRTLLYYATNRVLDVLASDSDLSQTLIEQGAIVNVKDNAGMTPLHYAVMDYRYSENAALLIVNGADINARDNFGRTPLHYAAKHSTPSSQNIESILAAPKLSNPRRFFGSGSGGWYRGGRKSTQSKTPRTSEATNTDKAAGTDSQTAVETQDDKVDWYIKRCKHEGKTPVRPIPESWLEKSPLELLIVRGAEINVRDNFGRTPLHFARNNPEAAALLKTHGAIK